MSDSAPIYNPDGRLLDARFSVEESGGQLSVVFESSGGGKNPRNREYNEGLRLILERLVAQGATLLRVLVESRETQHMSIAERTVKEIQGYTLPLPLTSEIDCHHLRQKIGTGAARTARTKTSETSGNSQKRIRLVLGFTMQVRPELSELDDALRRGPLFDRPTKRARSGATAQDAGPAKRVRASSGGQGYARAEVRKAVEDYAMQKAAEHYTEEGWKVESRHLEKLGYDIECVKGRARIYVEVKGTTGPGESIIVTANEVAFANGHAAQCRLFIVANIRTKKSGDGTPSCSDGDVRILDPWAPVTEAQLEPINYHYFPNSSGRKSRSR